MADRSIFSPGGSGMTTGGLDGYLGPQGQNHSNLPESISDPEKQSNVPEIDCQTNGQEPVCQIAEAEKENRQRDSAS